jgi:hypothetical protein
MDCGNAAREISQRFSAQPRSTERQCILSWPEDTTAAATRSLSALGAASAGQVACVGRGGLCPRPAEDKPILLDIGAVWCHWCHVMDRESYENPEIAALINEHFVAMKVDRDERPDVDARYQAAVSAISGQGGWPLTASSLPMAARTSAAPISPRRSLRPAWLRPRAADHGPGLARAPRRSAGVGRQRDGGHRAERKLLRPRRRADAWRWWTRLPPRR